MLDLVAECITDYTQDMLRILAAETTDALPPDSVRGASASTITIIQVRGLLVAALLFWSGLDATYGLQPHTCKTADAEAAEKEADRLRSWHALHKSFLRFRQCDDGAIAEGCSESVARILVDHWDSLPRLGSISKKDNRFLQFVMNHVDATLDIKDIKTIRTNAVRHCSPERHELCHELKVAADKAQHETQ